MITQHELESFELTHKNSGNGLFWLCDLGDGMSKCCRLHFHPVPGVGEVLLADNRLLQVFTRRVAATEENPNPDPVPVGIHPELIPILEASREGMRTGKLKVVNQRLVPA